MIVREMAEFYFDLDNKTNFTTYSVLCSPLVVSGECIGVIHCLNKKTNTKLFEENDRKLLETLSGPAALAIKNAKTAKELIDKDSLKSKMDEWKFPYHFIDFETCQVALPFHKNQKPFTMLATQYSCHSLNEDGTIDHSEWIAKQDNHDPSFECIEKLYEVLGDNEGSIFMYSNYENYVLKSVKIRMEDFDKTHYSKYIKFLDSITFSPNENLPERALIDLKDIV